MEQSHQPARLVPPVQKGRQDRQESTASQANEDQPVFAVHLVISAPMESREDPVRWELGAQLDLREVVTIVRHLEQRLDISKNCVIVLIL